MTKIYKPVHMEFTGYYKLYWWKVVWSEHALFEFVRFIMAFKKPDEWLLQLMYIQEWRKY